MRQVSLYVMCESEIMTSLEDSGFLALDMQHWISKHRSANRDCFGLADELNSFAQKRMFALDISKQDYQQLLVATAFLRALSMFQGAIIMLERGMIFEAGILIRGQIEGMFIVAAASKSREFAKNFILSDGAKKLGLMKNLLRSSDRIQQILGDQASWDDVNKLKADLAAEGIKDFQIADIARQTDYMDWYTVVYTFLSQMLAHPTARSLDKYLSAGEDGEVSCLSWGPDVYGISKMMGAAIECLIVVLEKVSKLFEAQWKPDLDRFHDRLRELSTPETGMDFGFRTT